MWVVYLIVLDILFVRKIGFVMSDLNGDRKSVV